MGKKYKEKNNGSVMDFLTVGITLLAIAILVTATFQTVGLMIKKLEISQVARKYILIMETTGFLAADMQQNLFAELDCLGVKEADISGTTVVPVEYGSEIVLCIHGKIRGEKLKIGNNLWPDGIEIREYSVEEIRMSTAKN